MRLVNPQATKPDHWKSVTRIKLPTAPKAHKPADSGLVVGSAARCCSLPDYSFGNVPQSHQDFSGSTFRVNNSTNALAIGDF
jgi:hypothetical protein